MTDSLTSNSSAKSLGVIDAILEVSRNLTSLKLLGKARIEIIFPKFMIHNHKLSCI